MHYRINKLSCHCYFIKFLMRDEFIRFQKYKNRVALRFRVQCVSTLSVPTRSWSRYVQMCVCQLTVQWTTCVPVVRFKQFPVRVRGKGQGLGVRGQRLGVRVKVSRVSSCSYTRVRKRISKAPTKVVRCIVRQEAHICTYLDPVNSMWITGTITAKQ